MWSYYGDDGATIIHSETTLPSEHFIDYIYWWTADLSYGIQGITASYVQKNVCKVERTILVLVNTREPKWIYFLIILYYFLTFGDIGGSYFAKERYLEMIVCGSRCLED